MKISPKTVKVREIFNGYIDKDEDGVFALGGDLVIRPKYQREFIYNSKQEEAVIKTILKGFPLNIMYWVKLEDGTYEVLDGQQRTLSVMRFLKHLYPITLNDKEFYFDSFEGNELNTILNYEFLVYECEGSPSEKLEWFEIVNVAGEPLTPQELLNSVYTGPWLTDAKKIFSQTGGAAKKLSDKYIIGTPIRQEILEKALKGITEYKNLNDITLYMANNKNEPDANELWQYFQDAIHWIEKIFPVYYKEMKGLDWLHLYNKYNVNIYNSSKIEQDVKMLMSDEEVQKKKGIFEYLLSKDKDPYAARLLDLRTFYSKDKREKYEEQKGICSICNKKFEIEDMEGDHIVPWSKGGLTEYDNLQMICKNCNVKKSGTY